MIVKGLATVSAASFKSRAGILSKPTAFTRTCVFSLWTSKIFSKSKRSLPLRSFKWLSMKFKPIRSRFLPQ